MSKRSESHARSPRNDMFAIQMDVLQDWKVVLKMPNMWPLM